MDQNNNVKEGKWTVNCNKLSILQWQEPRTELAERK